MQSVRILHTTVYYKNLFARIVIAKSSGEDFSFLLMTTYTKAHKNMPSDYQSRANGVTTIILGFLSHRTDKNVITFDENFNK